MNRVLKSIGLAGVCLLVTPLPVLSQDISPDFFVDGSCEDVVDWASQPVEDLMEELKAGEYLDAAVVNGSYGSTILQMTKETPVASNWFEKKCTFSDEQLSGMGNLHTAYVAYMESLVEE